MTDPRDETDPARVVGVSGGDDGRLPGRTTLVVVGVLVVVGIVAGVLWFMGREAPEAVDIDAAAELADAGESPGSEAVGGVAAESPQRDTDAEPPSGESEVTWVVDTGVVPFSLEESTGTFTGFRIAEELANIGESEAVGRTPEVEGSLIFAEGRLHSAEISADLTAIVSDQPRRDPRIQTALDTANHPHATFSLSEPVEVGELVEGQVVDVEAEGMLTLHGVPNPVSVPLQAVLRDEVVVVTGSFGIVFSDYEIDLPTAPIVISVEDRGLVEIQLYLRPV